MDLAAEVSQVFAAAAVALAAGNPLWDWISRGRVKAAVDATPGTIAYRVVVKRNW